MPRVSVIIPAYNAGHFIRTAVDSVLNQTFQDLELIVVDDGSTDSTLDALSQVTDNRLRVICRARGERSAARNTGVEASTGEYAAFLDADDWWHPRKLERQLELFGIRPQLGLVYCWLRPVGPNGRLYRALTGHISEKIATRQSMFSQLLVGMPTGTSALILKRRALEESGGFQAGLSYGEDWDLCLRVSLKFDCGVLPETLASYRVYGLFLPAKQNNLGMQDALYRIVSEAIARSGIAAADTVCRHALARVAMLGSFVDMAIGEFDSANTRLRQARVLDPASFEGNSPAFCLLLAGQANHLYDTYTSFEEAMRFVDMYFMGLSNDNAVLRCYGRRVRGEVCAAKVFEEAEVGTQSRIRRAFWHALRVDPLLVGNVGLMKLGARSHLSLIDALTSRLG